MSEEKVTKHYVYAAGETQVTATATYTSAVEEKAEEMRYEADDGSVLGRVLSTGARKQIYEKVVIEIEVKQRGQIQTLSLSDRGFKMLVEAAQRVLPPERPAYGIPHPYELE